MLALVATCAAFGPWTSRPAEAVLSIRGGNGVPLGYAPKDFAMIWTNGEAHVFYILNNTALRLQNTHTSAHLNERRFGHAVSTDLDEWTFVDSSFVAGASPWDRDHVWSPSIVKKGSTYWMFYTGVRDTMIDGLWLSGTQRIGVAWSNDLTTWNRAPNPIVDCGSSVLPWGDCNGGGARDPFVMREDGTVPGSLSPPGWLLYYTTKPDFVPSGSYNPYAFVVGVARAPFQDLTQWTDLGPMWSTYRNYQVEPGSNQVESPHLVKIGGVWYLFFTGDGGVFQLTGDNPLGDVGQPTSEWEFDGHFGELWSDEYASETFTATWEDGTAESFLASLQSLANYGHTINLRTIRPSGATLLADPLMLDAILTSHSRAIEGDTVQLVLRAGLPSIGTLLGDTLTRAAPLRLWEVDSLPGNVVTEKKWPIDYGLPSVVHVRTQYLDGDEGDVLTWIPEWVQDDDSTPDRDELRIEIRGTTAPMIYVYRSTALVGVDDGTAATVPPLRLGTLGRPGSPEILLSVELAAAAEVRIEIFDASGRKVRALESRILPAGRSLERWDGRDASGASVSSGLYFARASADGAEARCRLLRLR